MSCTNGLLDTWKEKGLDCRRDLFVTDPKEDRAALKRKKGGHAPGSCAWILNTEELTTWLSPGLTGPESESAQVLWLYGNPGTGKSIMAICLTEGLPIYLADMEGATLAYFFCDSGFDTRRTATSIIRGLLHQLIRQHHQLLDHLLPEYNTRGKKLFSSLDALWDIFMAMVADQSMGRTYCIIDAVDECDKESQQTLLQQLENFQSQKVSSNVRILITSRPYPEIRESLQMFPNRDLASFTERQKDIDLCIDYRVNRLAKRKKYTEKVREQVRDILRYKAEGTFLWIGLACDELKDIPSYLAIKFLQDMPKGLHAEEDAETRIQFTHEYIESCRLLVIIQDEDVLLLHQSVKDYLVGTGSGFFIKLSEAHARLAYRCVDMLIEQFRSTNQLYNSFSYYAILEWVNHARMGKEYFKVQCPQAEFFQIDSPCRGQWLENARSIDYFFLSIPNDFSIFHVAAKWGISTLVDYASELGFQESDTQKLTRGVHINCKDASGKIPLERAIMSRYPNAVAALLSQGGNVTIQLVEIAAGNWLIGEEVMALLLDHCGVQISITDKVVRAAAGNDESGKEVIALLLDRCGDQINITDEVVEAAAGNWTSGKEMIALLLDHCGDQINITDEVVEAAAGNWTSGKEVIALLLDHCGDQINITDEVVEAAAGNWTSGKEVIALLLDHCGDQINITDEVVKAAAGNLGSGKEVITLLLEHCGDQINITEEVVKAAAGNWTSGKEVIAMLLEHCRDQINITDEVVKAAAGN
ncbi:hypothetical protein N7495_009604 [Penicillium taxi]|uniref:uncharacterized protein n=1 Tax=Penicillium taxi TaxID=168475 RepID=UPI0025459C19|nr:uncharacterized protein N7495_009604 [Penicillium taxi]KAJ5885094.1 hypothetical protein N7495_009604 [Penicillium taxi]